MQRRGAQAGFTLVEMLVVITIIGILAGLALPNITKARTKAKETEVKAGLHSIQTSLERYYVDNQQFPAYILGGSTASWTTYQQRLDPDDPHRKLNDPLIENGYIDSYPTNPFVADGSAVIVESGGNPTDPGSGDPRFGMNGTGMANIMDDPRFFDELTTPTETLKQFAYSRLGKDANKVYEPYPSGGKLNTNVNPGGEPVLARNWWEGDFFYRAVGPIDFASQHPAAANQNPREVWTYYVGRYDSYILGGYGAKVNDGQDVIRTGINQNAGQFYRTPPATSGMAYPQVSLDNGQGNVSSLPEVMGGGDPDNNPYFPYTKVGQDANGNPQVLDGEYTYGAPDGIPDGVVMVLTPAGS
ncbi:MAG TPA: type II secretion system protein, partial [bacterium]|nr:type II secretion system protein [bacterium]